jgi:hypothetical protein
MHGKYFSFFFSLNVVDAEVNPCTEAHGESPSSFQRIDQSENIADKLLAG